MSFKRLNLPDQVRGDTWEFQFIMEDSSNSPINIDTFQYWLTLKSDVDLADNQAEMQFGPFEATGANAIAGILDLVIIPTYTDNLTPGTYNYDLQEVDSSGGVKTLLLGKVRATQDITLASEYSGTGTITLVSSGSGIALYSGDTTSVGSQEIYLNGLSNNYLNISSEGILTFDALICGKDSITEEACAFQLRGALENQSGTTAIIGGVGKIILAKENVIFDAEIVANDTEDALQINVTPASANSTRWAVKIDYTEVVF
jgi:hypothetical protein